MPELGMFLFSSWQMSIARCDHARHVDKWALFPGHVWVQWSHYLPSKLKREFVCASPQTGLERAAYPSLFISLSQNLHLEPKLVLKLMGRPIYPWYKQSEGQSVSPLLLQPFAMFKLLESNIYSIFLVSQSKYNLKHLENPYMLVMLQ